MIMIVNWNGFTYYLRCEPIVFIEDTTQAKQPCDGSDRYTCHIASFCHLLYLY
jgi:hypothetical protein